MIFHCRLSDAVLRDYKSSYSICASKGSSFIAHSSILDRQHLLSASDTFSCLHNDTYGIDSSHFYSPHFHSSHFSPARLGFFPGIHPECDGSLLQGTMNTCPFTHSFTHSFTLTLASLPTGRFLGGGNQKTQRKPTQTQWDHVKLCTDRNRVQNQTCDCGQPAPLQQITHNPQC